MRLLLVAITIFFCISLPAHAQEEKTNSFLEAGIPAASREWLGSDYALTFQILSSGKVALPRFSEKDGAALLRRITSTENFSLQKNQTIPLQVRLGDYTNLLQGAGSLFKLYYSTSIEKKQNLNTELSNLLAFMLHVSAQGIDLVEEFIPNIPKDDSYAARMEGVRKMYSGLTTVFVGAEVMLTEKNGLSSSDRSAVLDAMAITLPRNKKAFPQDYRIELRKKLEADRKYFSSPEDIQKIDTMLLELN